MFGHFPALRIKRLKALCNTYENSKTLMHYQTIWLFISIRYNKDLHLTPLKPVRNFATAAYFQWSIIYRIKSLMANRFSYLRMVHNGPKCVFPLEIKFYLGLTLLRYISFFRCQNLCIHIGIPVRKYFGIRYYSMLDPEAYLKKSKMTSYYKSQSLTLVLDRCW